MNDTHRSDTHRGADPAQRDADGSVADAADVAALVFETLFETTRIAVRATGGGHGGKASPSQMFEPNVADANERHRMALEESRPSGDADRSVNRLDRTSVDARSALRKGQGLDTHPQIGGGRIGSAVAPGRSATSAVGPLPDRFEGGAQASSKRLAGLVSKPPVGSNFAPPGSVASGTSSAATPPGTRLNSVTASPPAARSTAASITGVRSAGESQATTPASRMAQLLAGGRAGEVESARAPSSSSAATDARTSGGDPKTAGRTPTPRPPDPQTSSARSERAHGKLGGSGRSAFDDLVRSIRLQTGGRHSSARLHLHPPQLGRLHVDVRLTGEVLRVDVRTETAAARELIAARAAELATALEQHGIHVDRFEVTYDQPGDLARDRHDGGAAGEAVTTHQPGYEQPGGSQSPADRPLSEDTGPSAPADAEPEDMVVAETRLDITV